jgi:hypothetical protein
MKIQKTTAIRKRITKFQTYALKIPYTKCVDNLSNFRIYDAIIMASVWRLYECKNKCSNLLYLFLMNIMYLNI